MGVELQGPSREVTCITAFNPYTVNCSVKSVLVRV